uniref:MADS-box domain-containing protein n=1 Tax=Oryza punctata TaxID=4537 RepID=A0A0E0LEG2_ORYPU
MGRGKIEIKRIEDATRRQVSFSKRRAGLLKKAHELAVLCDAQVGVVVFSDKGKLFDFCSKPVSLMELIHRYEITTAGNNRLQKANRDDEQMLMEITRLRSENDQLEASLRRQTGEDLSCVATVDDGLSQLQLQLESALSKVRERKDELMRQQLEDMRRMQQTVHEQNNFLCLMMSENWTSPASGEASAMEALTVLPAATAAAEAEAFGHNCFFPEEEGVAASSTALQLWPHDGDQPNLRLW